MMRQLYSLHGAIPPDELQAIAQAAPDGLWIVLEPRLFPDRYLDSLGYAAATTPQLHVIFDGRKPEQLEHIAAYFHGSVTVVPERLWCEREAAREHALGKAILFEPAEEESLGLYCVILARDLRQHLGLPEPVLVSGEFQSGEFQAPTTNG